MLQRTKEWYDARKGRFTASEIYRLCGKESLKSTQESITSYCEEKANEIVFGINEDEGFVSADVRRGIELEPIAFEKFSELKFLDFIDVNTASFYVYNESSGASPDGLVGSDSVLEIKCPRPEKFFRIIRRGYDALDDSWKWQMQHQMLCTNSVKAHFFAYQIYNGVEMWHEIIVLRNEEMIGTIKERISKAVILRDEFVEYLIKEKQF